MANEGWVKIYRSLSEHWLLEDKPFSKGQAWIDLLLLVNHSERKTLIDGRLETVNTGQTITSTRKLCDRWGWSNTKVRNFLKLLENESMISIKNDSKKTVINVVNYSAYQECNSEKTTVGRQSDDSQATVKHTNKNEKNEKNNNIRRFTPPTYEQVSSYCLERNNNVDAQRFVDHYQANGWMRGKTKMKDWKAAVRFWERSNGGGSKTNNNNLGHMDCERDYDFGSLEQQLLRKQQEGM